MRKPILLLTGFVAAGWGCIRADACPTAGRSAPCAPVLRAEAPTPPRAGDPLAGLAKDLASPRPEDRRRAVRRLAAEGSLGAWRHLCGALLDSESAVADDAQLALARLDDPEFLSELCGRAGLGHRDPGLRRRVAEALGRVALTVDALALLAALDDREAEVARLALWSLERQLRARRVAGDLERAGLLLERAARSHRHATVRASALLARAALFDADATPSPSVLEGYVDLLARCSDDRDARVRCAVVIAARELPAGRALALTAKLRADPVDSVRLAWIETCDVLACGAGVRAMIDRLEGEGHPRARQAIVGALRRMSGLKHRDDPRPWRDWARDLADDWRPALLPSRAEDSVGQGRPAAEDAGAGRTQARASFVGLPVVSTRLCFAIDFSGSMWTPMPDGRMPKELVDARLRATLESLPPSTRFNVVPFTNDVLPWRPALVPAQPSNVRDAIAEFERCTARGRGNFFDAALFALEDPDVDTLVTLTDGIPTGGFHSDLELVIPLLLERNRVRRVAFDTVLVDAPAGAERRWRTLSEHSLGRLVATERAE